MQWFRSMTGTETFTDRMSRVVREHDLEVLNSDDESCLLSVPSRGERFEMFLMLASDSDTVVMMIVSNVLFRRGRLPGAVCTALEKANGRTDRCAYDTHDGRDGSRFVVRSFIPLSKLNPQTFALAVQDMAPRITALDEVLEKKGYVR